MLFAAVRYSTVVQLRLFPHSYSEGLVLLIRNSSPKVSLRWPPSEETKSTWFVLCCSKETTCGISGPKGGRSKPTRCSKTCGCKTISQNQTGFFFSVFKKELWYRFVFAAIRPFTTHRRCGRACVPVRVCWRWAGCTGLREMAKC